MDPIASRENLFSRGPSPPTHQPLHISPPPPQHEQHHEQQHAPQPSHHDTNTTATNALDSLFHNLTAPAPHQVSPQQPAAVPNAFSTSENVPHSGPATPASVNAGSISSGHSGPGHAIADRQNALLSLLGAVSSPAASTTSVNTQSMTSNVPQQVPTPPGSAPRVATHNAHAHNPHHSESQGKFLLEQLMSGAKLNNEPQLTPYTMPSVGSVGSGGPSPTYLPSHVDPESQQPVDYYGETNFTSVETTPVHETPQQQSQQHPPSPGRRSLFDFVSPFDALSGPSSGPQPKRKPVPPQPSSVPSTTDDVSSWTTASMDPKRKSVENLMDQLTRGQGPLPHPAQSVTAQFDPYAPQEEATPHAEPTRSRPLPPQPTQHGTSSPRASPPKPVMQARQQRRSADSPIGPAGLTNYQAGPKDSGQPVAGSYRQEARGKNQGAKGKASPNVAQQTILFDVSQPLSEVQAPHDAVKSTAIALVKVDSTFLPGSTIGATHWVAYGMSKGRVRVISRSSGDRTLLQLPSLFPTSVTVSDMSVYGNRLAGVTSDGGLVVWELPEVIRDDVAGKIVLCVLPANDLDPLHAVKWHPHEPDYVAVASETNVYLVNISDAHQVFGGEPIPQSELQRVGQLFTVPSPIIAFDFDVPRSALATISEDSTLTMWNIRDKLPFWSHRIRGDDMPSSLTFVDNGVVIGRRNGTVFQLLNVMGRNVLSTIKFVNGANEDPDMFGHVNYDARIQTLWIANNRRESMIAFKLNFDTSTPSPGGEEVRGPYFDQVVEFSGPKPTIHFVILTAHADPHGLEAQAACVAAKVPPGELALVAFAVHSSGVDQILIRKEWFTTALANTPEKFPLYVPPTPQQEHKSARQPQYYVPPVQHHLPPAPVQAGPVRAKTPPSEDIEGVDSREEGRGHEIKGRGQKGKNPAWKNNNDESSSGRDNAKGKAPENGGSDSQLATVLTKEIKKVEENLHTKIGRMLGKELDKQQQRLEDARVNEQAADLSRQEKILKLISTELTKNTTRVVEMAVKSEVQNSVLPALENITKNEIKTALSNQISKGLADAMKQNLPTEIERLLLRPDVSNHIARTFSSAVTPLVEKQVKDTITKTLIPAYSQQSSGMHQELSHEIHSEVLNLKKEIITWQSEALRGQETLIRDLEQSVRMLSEQVKYLSMNAAASNQTSHQASRGSPVPAGNSQHHQLLRQTHMPPVSQPSSSYGPPHSSFPTQQQQQQGPPIHGPWFGPSIAAPQASHPTAPPPIPSQASGISNLNHTPPLHPQQPEEWDDTYLAVLGSQDSRQLRELLARSNPDTIMPMSGGGPLSQAVVLTLVHRLSAMVGETPPSDESFKSTLWWLQRASSTLNTSDPLISPYVSRVMPSVQQMLNTTKQRIAILPGGPLLDTARTISDVQDMLARKPM
ncbi:hypothetical protein BDY19DRAFT_881333 [Irpex rosettiformis]|uniref:Uncharacterized protein n=1 Tax=Irpex rosettiformis TaxID=378272 RepID=A0ACB8UI04_9APHY|nr:hypothetical protein BDY19DRAFT_881333 [Irpex rosettiformis]